MMENFERAFSAPITTTAPRWQRKAMDLLSGTPSSPSLASSSTGFASSSSLSNAASNAPSAAQSTTATPTSTPMRISSGLSSSRPDRFIPSRSVNGYEESHYLLTSAAASSFPGEDTNGPNALNSNSSSSSSFSFASNGNGSSSAVVSPSKLHYQQAMASQLFHDTATKVLSFAQPAPKPRDGFQGDLRVLYSSSCSSAAAAASAAAARKSVRYIPQNPDRILDAPELRGDFYLNTIDWGTTNTVAVALGKVVYLWNAGTGSIMQLCEASSDQDDEYISSVSWLNDGVHVAVGNSLGEVQIWDASTQQRVRAMYGHTARVPSLSWNEHILSSGARNGMIMNSDVRIREHCVATLRGHSQEVCGLRWSPDGKYLASGGNDNLVNIWTPQHTLAHTFTQHTAAVKALSWCPWQPTLLASGGGSADHHVRFWNAASGACVSSTDVQTQVCGLLWNREHRELITGHGSNNLSLWKYPAMSKVAELTGHTQRVLCMAISPDGQTVVSAGADETLRFWKCFASDGKAKAKKTSARDTTSRLTLSLR